MKLSERGTLAIKMVYLVAHYLSGPNCLILAIGQWVIALVFFSKLANFQLFKLNMPSRPPRRALSEYVDEIKIRHSHNKLLALEVDNCAIVQL